MLRYPLEIQSGQDFVSFSHEPYRTNNVIAGQNKDVAPSDAGPPASGTIVLYMPNSTPQISNQNSWKEQQFIGPLGEITRNMGVSLAAGAMNLGKDGMGIDAAVDNFQRNMKEVMKKGGDAGRQFVLGRIAEAFNMSGAGALTSLQRGEVYNPNVELLYESPKLRAFSMDFVFIPKSPAEAKMMNDIILEFKANSAPSDNETMLKVPHLWRVTYKSGVGNDKFMNKFKKAALTTVTIQHNPGTDMHATFADGTPLVTAMSLGFQEVDIITKEDHVREGGQGF